MGIFPWCYPLEWDTVWGRQQSWHIEHHRRFGRGPEQCLLRSGGLTSTVWEAGYELPHHPLDLAEYLGLVYGCGGSCHHHGRLTRLSLDSFLYFAKSNSSYPLVDLISLFILSIHETLILSYPSFHIPYLPFYLFFKYAGLLYDVRQDKGTTIYSYEGGWSSSANLKVI